MSVNKKTKFNPVDSLTDPIFNSMQVGALQITKDGIAVNANSQTPQNLIVDDQNHVFFVDSYDGKCNVGGDLVVNGNFNNVYDINSWNLWNTENIGCWDIRFFRDGNPPSRFNRENYDAHIEIEGGTGNADGTLILSAGNVKIGTTNVMNAINSKANTSNVVSKDAPQIMAPITAPTSYISLPGVNQIGEIINVPLGSTDITINNSTFTPILASGYQIPAGVWISNLVVSLWSPSGTVSVRVWCGVSSSSTSFSDQASSDFMTIQITRPYANDSGTRDTYFLGLTAPTTYYPGVRMSNATSISSYQSYCRWQLIRIA